jgi:alpha-glucosidase
MSAVEFDIDDKAGVEATPWWKGACIYQVYPRSFSDSNGDGVGDLSGLTERLDYIESLGVDAIWISPFFKSPMADFGYDVSDYCDVDPIFGTLADFDLMIAKAHRLGLKVVIDQVYSHTSSQHAWFEESRQSKTNVKSDWFVWADAKPDGTPPNNWQSVFGGAAWTWDARRGQYYMHNFLSSQPQLNLHNPEVQDAILGVMRFWFDRGVDGFRLDAVSFMMHDPQLRDNPARGEDATWAKTRSYDFQKHLYNQSQPPIIDFLKRARELADQFGGRYLVAEIDREHAEWEMKAYSHGDELLQSTYGFTYLYADQLTPGLVAKACEEWPGEPQEGWPSWTFSNHDAPRAVSRWSRGRSPEAFAKMLLLLLVSLRGNIFLYQGEELGLPQAEVPFDRLQDPEAITNWPKTLGRDGARTPMPWSDQSQYAGFSAVEPWLPVDDRHTLLSVAGQDLQQSSTLNWAREILRLRSIYTPLREGDLELVEAGDNLLVFKRRYGSEEMICAFNLGHNAISWQLPASSEIVAQINEDASAIDELQSMQAIVARQV